MIINELRKNREKSKNICKKAIYISWKACYYIIIIKQDLLDIKEMSKCYKLIKHYGVDHSESVVAVSHKMEKLHKALKVLNVKGWEVLSEDQLEWAHQREGNYFAVVPVTYL